MFKVIKRDNGTSARVGEFMTSHGMICTPVFMPVATRGTIRAMALRDLIEIGFDIILSNTYHIFIRPGLDVIEKAGGLHNFMNYHKPILTDSGGFQVFSLSDLCRIHDNGVEFKSHLDGSKHFFSPEGVLDMQGILGSDIMMMLDQCIPYPSTEEETKNAVDRTVAWGKNSIAHWRTSFDAERQPLFAIVQGGLFADLRVECAEKLIEMDFPGFAIGGLSVGEPKDLYREITELVTRVLPEDRPRYMMGVGSPLEILYAVSHGVDMFDCVMPTRIARNGTLFTSEGRINIKSSKYRYDFSPLDEKCSCYVCNNFTRAYLRHIFKIGEISSLIYNTYHNLYFMHRFMAEIREEIQSDGFSELYEKWESVF